MKHYEGLTKYNDKPQSALQSELHKAGNFMSAKEAHANACVESVCEERLMDDSMVANKFGLLMSSTDNIHQENVS